MSNTRASAEPSFFFFMTRALRFRNYRIFFTGQLISLIGTWITSVATSWLAFRLSGDSVVLGMVTFAAQIPTFIIVPFAGVLTDRWNLHRMLLATQSLAMLQSVALAILTFTDLISVPSILALSVVQGIINGFDLPARQAILVEIVEDRSDLPNAIALNSLIFNGARLLGPAIAGILIAALGEAYCFALDGVSYLAVIAALLAMKLPKRERKKSTKHVLHDLSDGIRYTFHLSPIRSIILLTASVGFLAIPYSVLLPIFSTEILSGGPTTLGLLTGASGFGAVVGALILAARRSVHGLAELIPLAGAALGIALIVFSWSTDIFVSCSMVAITGLCILIQLTASNTILQSVVHEEKRGRVLSLFAMSFQGSIPLGGVAAGFLAQPEALGPQVTVAVTGVCCLGCALLFYRALPDLHGKFGPLFAENRRGKPDDTPTG